MPENFIGMNFGAVGYSGNLDSDQKLETMKKQTVVAPLNVATDKEKKMYVAKRSNETQPLEYTVCTHIPKGKDYPYNSTKRGWSNESLRQDLHSSSDGSHDVAAARHSSAVD